MRDTSSTGLRPRDGAATSGLRPRDGAIARVVGLALLTACGSAPLRPPPAAPAPSRALSPAAGETARSHATLGAPGPRTASSTPHKTTAASRTIAARAATPLSGSCGQAASLPIAPMKLVMGLNGWRSLRALRQDGSVSSMGYPFGKIDGCRLRDDSGDVVVVTADDHVVVRDEPGYGRFDDQDALITPSGLKTTVGDDGIVQFTNPNGKRDKTLLRFINFSPALRRTAIVLLVMRGWPQPHSRHKSRNSHTGPEMPILCPCATPR